MLLDIKKIFGTYDEPVTAALELDLSEEDFPGYTVPGTVEARITATLQGRMLEIALDITADVAFACARCLEERTRRFHVIKTYCVREADLSDPDAELSFTPDGKLDVRELAYTELVLEVPTVLLCSDDCAGLCPVCGNRKQRFRGRKAFYIETTAQRLDSHHEEVLIVAVPKRKVSKARRDKRRSSVWKLTAPTLTKCTQCGEYKLPHQVCGNCGYYKGKEIVKKEA